MNPGGGEALNFFLVGMFGVKRRNGGLKSWFFAKVWSEELTFVKILQACVLKFDQIFGWRADFCQIFANFLL